MRVTLGQVQRERADTARWYADVANPFARTGDLIPPPPPTGSAANTTGIVIALGVLGLAILGLRHANKESERWGGPGGRG